MNSTMNSTKEKAKARLLDEYMRTGDLAALVKGYTDLNANSNAEPKSPETPVRDPHKENTGYTYFDVTF